MELDRHTFWGLGLIIMTTVGFLLDFKALKKKQWRKK